MDVLDSSLASKLVFCLHRLIKLDIPIGQNNCADIDLPIRDHVHLPLEGFFFKVGKKHMLSCIKF